MCVVESYVQMCDCCPQRNERRQQGPNYQRIVNKNGKETQRNNKYNNYELWMVCFITSGFNLHMYRATQGKASALMIWRWRRGPEVINKRTMAAIISRNPTKRQLPSPNNTRVIFVSHSNSMELRGTQSLPIMIMYDGLMTMTMCG